MQFELEIEEFRQFERELMAKVEINKLRHGNSNRVPNFCNCIINFRERCLRMMLKHVHFLYFDSCWDDVMKVFRSYQQHDSDQDHCQNTCSRCINIHERAEILLRNILASYKKETLGVCTHCGFKMQPEQFRKCKCEDVVKTFLISSFKEIDEDKHRTKIESETEDNPLEMRTLSNSESNSCKTAKENIGQIINFPEETSTRKSIFLPGQKALERKQNIKLACSCPGLSQKYESNANFYETFCEIKDNTYDRSFRLVFPLEHKESERHDVYSSMLLHDLQAKDNNKNKLSVEQHDSDLERIKLAVDNMKLSDGKRTSMGFKMTSQHQVKTLRSQRSSSLVNSERNKNAEYYPKLHDELPLGDKSDKPTTGHKPKLVNKTKIGDETKLSKQVNKSKLDDKGKKLTRGNEKKKTVLKEFANVKPTLNKKMKRTVDESEAKMTANKFNKDYLKETIFLLKAKREKQCELAKKKDGKFVERRRNFISVKKVYKPVVPPVPPPPPTIESHEISNKFSIAQYHTETTGPKTTNTILKSKTASTETFKQEVDEYDGVIRYALSDRKFIDMGWTQLPAEKVVRKLNVYRMHPLHPEFDWFTNNKGKGKMLYDSGETLAKVSDDGRGRWFYRNGNLALDYYHAEEIKAGKRYVLYSSGEPDERGRSRPRTVLATFDHSGNGVVYDHNGAVRLKYNQNEGVVLDRSIGPKSHWMWHALNDPPVMQHVMIETQMPFRDHRIEEIQYPGEPRKSKSTDSTDMVAIEFKNLIKERLMQKSVYRPFQIKMKALKINEKFSLKILDQAKVYLIYRDGATHIKINIGMTLDNSEIVDTVTCDVDYVYNTLEEFPGRTESIAALQRTVAQAQGAERVRECHARRLRPPAPSASVDRLRAGLSRPMRPLATNSSATKTTKLNDAVTIKYAPCKRFSYNINCDNLTLRWVPNILMS